MNIPINHVILIPLTLAVGFMLGWRLGAQSVFKQWQRADEKRRRAED